MKPFINKTDVKNILCKKENLLRTESLNKVMLKERRKKTGKLEKSNIQLCGSMPKQLKTKLENENQDVKNSLTWEKICKVHLLADEFT